ncbi:MAG: hypothetical protein V1911_02570 [Candidatus Micrarchaeota archaeon]
MVSHILNDFEAIKSKIISETDFTEASLEQAIAAKQEEYGGLLTRAGAAYSIAKERGIVFGDEAQAKSQEVMRSAQAEAGLMKIKELKGGLNNVSAVVRAVSVLAPRNFDSQNKKGTVTNIFVRDETGEARLVVWNNQQFADSVKKNDLLKIGNAYTKDNNGRIEIHTGYRTTTEKIEDKQSKIEKTAEKRYKLSEVTDNLQEIDFEARIERCYPIYTFPRERGGQKTGTVSSVFVNDGTASVRLVLWDSLAKLSTELSPNDAVRVESAYSKNNNGKLEIHAGWKARMLKIDGKNLPEVKRDRLQISELVDQTDVEIKADIVDVYTPSVIELCPKCRSMMRNRICEKCGGQNEPVYSIIVNAELDDGTGVIRGTFYRQLAERLLNIDPKELKADPNIFELKKKKVLGEEKVFFGYVKNIAEFERKEFVVRDYYDPDIDKEFEKLGEKRR